MLYPPIGIDVAVDMRSMTSTPSGKPVPLTSVAHPTESSWQAAHMLTVFQVSIADSMLLFRLAHWLAL